MASNTADRGIAHLVRIAPVLRSEDTVRRAAGLVREFEGSELPVSHFGQIAGMVTERAIMGYLAAAEDVEAALDAPVGPLVTGSPVMVNSSTTLQGAASAFASTNTDVLPVIENNGRFAGVLLRRDVMGLLTRTLRPPTVAGMATPLGVFLTTGSHTGGVGNLGLFLTGASLAAMMFTSFLIVDGLSKLLAAFTGLPIVPMLASPPLTAKLNIYDLAFYTSTVLSIVVFGALLRFSPLSGYHAAEHMTVHAIEVGETLTADVVRNMPRVHPRCGTNLLAAAGVFMIIVSRLSGGAAVMIALVVVVIGWRTVGGWLQYLVTTRNPSEKQLASGVKAGRELLESYQERPNRNLTGLERIWRMGLLQTASGLAAGYGVLLQVFGALGINVV